MFGLNVVVMCDRSFLCGSVIQDKFPSGTIKFILNAEILNGPLTKIFRSILQTEEYEICCVNKGQDCCRNDKGDQIKIQKSQQPVYTPVDHNLCSITSFAQLKGIHTVRFYYHAQRRGRLYIFCHLLWLI